MAREGYLPMVICTNFLPKKSWDISKAFTLLCLFVIDLFACRAELFISVENEGEVKEGSEVFL